MTSRPDKIADIWAAHRDEIQRDSVGPWMIAGFVRYQRPELSESETQDLVLDVIAYALRRGEAIAGTHRRGIDGLAEVWSEPTDEIITRIRREWDALGRVPHPGEVVMLEAPSQSSD